MTSYTIEELANIVGARVLDRRGAGAPTQDITGIASLADAGPSDLSHLSSTNYLSQLGVSRAGAILMREQYVEQCSGVALCVANPYWAFARLSQVFERPTWISDGIHVKANIDANTELADDARVGAGSVIGPGCVVKSGVQIHANAVVGADCVLGERVVLHPGVVLCDGVRIGSDSVVHPNSVIGAEGFGYAPDERGELERIAQLGTVLIGRKVSIGANTTIDRGALGDTLIGNGVKIDNQVQIGHNCTVGDHSVICGCCGIVGSTSIGRHVVLGGGVGVGGDGPLSICDGVTVSGMTHVSSSISEPGIYSGGVLHDRTRVWKRNALRFRQLNEFARRLARLERLLPTNQASRQSQKDTPKGSQG